MSKNTNGSIESGINTEVTDLSNDEFMSQFALPLVHLISQMDSTKLHQMTISGSLRSDEERKSFLQSCQGDGKDQDTDHRDLSHQISQTMKQAYNDMLVEQIRKVNSYQPIIPLLLELHAMIRSLIPNRQDLHSLLNDDHVKFSLSSSSRTDSTGQSLSSPLAPLLQLIIHAANALEKLESPHHTLTTQEWIDIGTLVHSQIVDHTTKDQDDKETDGSRKTYWKDMPLDTFVVSSISYLHSKVEQCKRDIYQFQFGQIIAPKINRLAKPYLQEAFQKQYGRFDEMATTKDLKRKNNMNIPHTQVWIEEMIRDSTFTLEDMIHSEEKRAITVLQIGFVSNILFRCPRNIEEEEKREIELPDGRETNNGNRISSTSISVDRTSAKSHQTAKPSVFHMPEVLLLDIQAIKKVRLAVKMSVIGCALALHATAVAGRGDKLLRCDPLDEDMEKCKRKLVAAMSNRLSASQEQFETDISNIVIEMGTVMNPSITLKSTIQGRTLAVLRAEDPVLQTLDNRVKDIFRNMVAWTPRTSQIAPIQMRSGRILSIEGEARISFDELFRAAARKEFATKGFAFYAEELTEACLQSSRIINHILDLYGAPLLDQLFLAVCNNQ